MPDATSGPLVAVFERPREFVRGVYHPEYPPGTSDWRAARGSPANTRKVRAEALVGPALATMARVWPTDAHLVTYVVYRNGAPLPYQPRVNKDGLEWLRAQGYELRHHMLMIDVDLHDPVTQKKTPWTQALRAEWTDKLRADAMERAGFYLSRSGLKIFYLLTRTLSPEEYERAVRVVASRLEHDGIVPDYGCVDWTRFFRLARIVRDGEAYDGGFYDSRVRAPGAPLDPDVLLADYDMIDEDAPPGSRKKPRIRRLHAVPKVFDEFLPEHWTARCDALGKALAVEGVGQYHEASLRLSGALFHSKVSFDFIPAIVAHTMQRAGATDAQHHWDTAQDSVRRGCAGVEITGIKRLRRDFPITAHELARVVATGRAAEAFAVASASMPDTRLPASECSAKIDRALDMMRDGVNGLAPDPGTGKSTAVLALAVRRAATQHKRADADETRAPPNSKTSIAPCTNELAIEQVAKLRRDYGADVARIYSPASLKDKTGAYVCKYSDAARALLAGGLSVRHELCDGRDKTPCEYRGRCPAYEGRDGSEHARIIVGPQALLSELCEHAGPTGVVAIDELSSLLETHEITLPMLDAAFVFAGIGRRYRIAMRPILGALRAFLLTPPRDVGLCLDAAVEAGRHGIETADLALAFSTLGLETSQIRSDDAISAAGRAVKPDARHDGVPFLPEEIQRTKNNSDYANTIRDVAVVYGVVYAAAAEWMSGADVLTRFWTEIRDENPVLISKRVNEDYVEAMRRPGVTVLLDADLHLHRELVERVVGYPVPVTSFPARDGAPVRRTQLLSVGATRGGWFARKRFPKWDRRLARSIELMLSWLREDPACQRVGLITFQLLERAIECLLPGLTEASRARWVGYDYPVSELEKADAAFGAALRAWPGTWTLGHYGAVRGVNRFERANLDAIITMGDAWPNLGDVQRDVEMLGIGGEPGDALDDEDPAEWTETIASLRAKELAEAQQRQALARIRECRVTRPVRQLHVGVVVPGGLGWRVGAVELRSDAGGVVKVNSEMTAETFSHLVNKVGLSTRFTAQRLNCGKSAVARYASGERKIPSDVAALLTSMADKIG